MRVQRNGSIASIDLHGLYCDKAKELLLNWLSHAPKDIQELRVIHGCNRGTALRDMVRDSLSHPRIQAKLPALSPGETRLLLK